MGTCPGINKDDDTHGHQGLATRKVKNTTTLKSPRIVDRYAIRSTPTSLNHNDEIVAPNTLLS